MDRKIVYLILALAAAFLFFFAIGFDGWGCGGSILGDKCLHFEFNQVAGALLLTAGFVVLIASILLILLIVRGYSWSVIAACVMAIISAVLSIAGVFYYVDAHKNWSPFIATAAMTLTTALSVILIFDLVTKH